MNELNEENMDFTPVMGGYDDDSSVSMGGCGGFLALVGILTLLGVAVYFVYTYFGTIVAIALAGLMSLILGIILISIDG